MPSGETSNVWNYTFSNGETIGATPNHPFFSERRKDYIPIGEIAIGEAIRNPQNEVITLISKTPRTNGAEKVYNLEIYRDHNFLVGNRELLVHNSCLPKISVIAPDWVTKGAHIHFDDIELAVRPDGRGGVIFQKVFSSTPDRDFDEAVKLAKEALNDPKWRLKFITQVEAGRTYMGTVTGALETLAKGRVAELSFLISALKKIK